jgi:putative membrane protein
MLFMEAPVFYRGIRFRAMLFVLSCGAAITFAMPALVAVVPVENALAMTSSAQFVEKAALASMFEVESSKIALSKSSEPEVKAFAEKMVQEHTAAGNDLDRAAKAGSTTYEVPSALGADYTQLLGTLAEASPEDFDRLYIEIQLAGHKDALVLFSDYAQSGDDPALKSFAEKTLPTLKRHHQMIEVIVSTRLQKAS